MCKQPHDTLNMTQTKGPFLPSDSGLKTVRILVQTYSREDEFGDRDFADPSYLSPSERERAGRFFHARDRWSYSAAHGLLRRMLSEYHGASPLTWQFRTGDYGRPQIDPATIDGVPPRFNISHTDGLVVCGLTLDDPEGVEVGVDVECLSRNLNASELAQCFFSMNEAAWLDSLPANQIQAGFIRLWTLKEAVAKATGRGLQLDFRSFSCSLNPLSVQFHQDPMPTGGVWDLATGFRGPGHWLSVAIYRPQNLWVTALFH